MGSNNSKKLETVENCQLESESKRLADMIEEIAQTETQVA